MGWRFRKRINIAPGVNVNLSKGGVSTTIGRKGVSVSMSKNGAYLNTSIPGTGLYHRQKLFSLKKKGITSTSSNINMLGCMVKGWGYISLFTLIGGIILLIMGEIQLEKEMIFGVIICFISVILIFGGNIIKSIMGSESHEDDVLEEETTQQNDSFSDPSSQKIEFKSTVTTKTGDVKVKPDIESFKARLKSNINEIKGNMNSINTALSIGNIDPYLFDIADAIVKEQSVSISFIQRKLTIGYNRASRIVDQLEKIGVVKRVDRSKLEVLVKDHASLELLFSGIKYDGISENIFGIEEDYYNSITAIVQSIVRLFQDIKKDDTIMYAIADCLPPDYGNKEQKLAALFLADIMKVHQHFGHSTANLKNREGFALVLLTSQILSDGHPFDITFEEINKLEDLSTIVPSSFSSLNHIFDQYPDENFFFIGQVLNRCRRRSFYTRYFTLLYRLFSFIAKADGSITKNEDIWLKKLLELNPQKDNVNIVFNVVATPSFTPTSSKDKTKEQEMNESKKEKSVESNEQESNSIIELDKLIGLSNVKTEINSLSNLVKVQKVRKSRGLSVSNISYHCVFTGNPGTGKTTVARIVAEIYKDLGVLKKGHLVETDRSGLVGEYVGQTAPKTNAIIDSALDGILFIDEAYSLVQGGQNDYGMEAISTLLKRMEDDRDRLIVILAGYSKEMEEFINSNSGLQSRFNRYIEFPDYTSSELMQIFSFIVKNNDYNLSEEALARISSVITDAVEHKDANFGNARFVRNLFEKIITQQANRITAESKITNEMLAKIEEIDIINAIK